MGRGGGKGIVLLAVVLVGELCLLAATTVVFVVTLAHADHLGPRPRPHPVAVPLVQPERAHPTSADYQAVRRLLAVRAKAVLAGDRAAFRDTLDISDKHLLERELTVFDNLQDLPVTSLSYAVGATDTAPDPIGHAGVAFAPTVVEHIGLDQAAEGAIANTTDLTFVRRGGRWLLAADNPGAGHNDAQPWLGAAVDVAVGRSVVVVADEHARVPAKQLLSRITHERAAVLRALGTHDQVHLLVDATTTGEPDRLNDRGSETAGAVTYGVFSSDGVDTDHTSLAGMVVKTNPDHPDAFAGSPETIRHELTHALDRDMLLAPTWVREGLAEYVAGYEDNISTPERALGRRLVEHERALPSDRDFGLHPDADYAISHAAVTCLIRRHGGMDGLKLFGEAYWTVAHGRHGDADTDRALRAAYGISEQQLLDETWDWLAHLPR